MLLIAAVARRVVCCPLLLSMTARAVLALRLVPSSSAGYALVVVAPSVVVLAAVRAAAHAARLVEVVRAGAETSSGRLAAGDHLRLVAVALQLGGEALPSRCPLLLVQVAGVEVSAVVSLRHLLALLQLIHALHVHCRCHRSLFDGCLAPIRAHRTANDTHVCLLGLGLGCLLGSCAGMRDRRRAGCSTARRVHWRRRHLLAVPRGNTRKRRVLDIIVARVLARLVYQVTDQVWLWLRRSTHVVCLHGHYLLHRLEATRTLRKLRAALVAVPGSMTSRCTWCYRYLSLRQMLVGLAQKLQRLLRA